MKLRINILKRCIKWSVSLGVVLSIISCVGSQEGLHNGGIPFRYMESPQSKSVASRKSGGEVEKMQVITEYVAARDKSNFYSFTDNLMIGDVVAFYMGKNETNDYLKKGKIQKLPYNMFRYGHVALIVGESQGEGLKLLQVAMKQKVNRDEGLEYLRDKNWKIFRPKYVNQELLREFVEVASERGNSESEAYDYSGAFGVKNASDKPESIEQISDEYTCCTLVTSALYYAGYELHSTRRGGVLDIVTPRQVVESWGSLR